MDEEENEEAYGPDPGIIHGDLSRWRNRPSIGSGHEADPESPSFGTNSSTHDSSADEEEYGHIIMESPPPLDEILTNTKDERRYRMLLQHEFHPSREFSSSRHDTNGLTQ